MRFLTIAAFALALVGCSDPRIDTSSEEALTESLREVRDSLPDEQRAEFEQIVMRAGFSAAMASALTKVPATATSVLQPLNGMTGAEAIAHHRAAEEKARIERAEKDARELALLESKEKLRNDGVARLSRIVVTDVETRTETVRFRSSHELHAKLRNNLDVPLARVSFDYVVKSPDRAVPWVSDHGHFFIDGGLEPGEERELEAAGSSAFAGFIMAVNALKDHPEAQIILSVTDAAGADKKSIVPVGLSPWEQAKLDELRVAAKK